MSLHHIQVKLPSPLPLAILQVFLSSASMSPSSLPPSPHPLQPTKYSTAWLWGHPPEHGQSTNSHTQEEK